MIDCLDEAKRLGNWTSEERRNLNEQVQRKLEASGSPTKSIMDIYHRIKHLGKTWTTPDRFSSLALYYYGWEALREECSRSVLLSDPTGRYIPKTIRSLKERYANLANSVGEATLTKKQAPEYSGFGYVFLSLVQVQTCAMRSYSVYACLTIVGRRTVLFTYQSNCGITPSISTFIEPL